jgi:hypothetical protein
MSDRYPNLRFQLSDRSGFERSIKYTNMIDIWIGAMVGAAGAAAIYGVYSAVRDILASVPLGAGDFLEVFASTGYAVTALVLLLIAAVGWVVKRATLRSSLDKAHQGYLAGGFLADAWQTGASLKPGQSVIVAYTPPGFPPETVGAFSGWAAAASRDPKNPANKAVIKSLGKIPPNPTTPVLATVIDATFPPGLWLVQSATKNPGLGIVEASPSVKLAPRPVVVVPKNAKRGTAYYIKDSVSLD